MWQLYVVYNCEGADLQMMHEAQGAENDLENSVFWPEESIGGLKAVNGAIKFPVATPLCSSWKGLTSDACLVSATVNDITRFAHLSGAACEVVRGGYIMLVKN
jgi:hypothetical protein